MPAGVNQRAGHVDEQELVVSDWVPVNGETAHANTFQDIKGRAAVV
jgi:hypothetical protein